MNGLINELINYNVVIGLSAIAVALILGGFFKANSEIKKFLGENFVSKEQCEKERCRAKQEINQYTDKKFNEVMLSLEKNHTELINAIASNKKDFTRETSDIKKEISDIRKEAAAKAEISASISSKLDMLLEGYKK